MSFIQLNSPSVVSWSAMLWDATEFSALGMAVAHSVRSWRRGRRDLAVLLCTALVYGTVLELSGMIWHHSYTQGTFLVMLQFTHLALFRHSTNMPLYVPFFYPFFLYLGYTLVEAVGIVRPLSRAVAGGFLMGCLDTPYILHGGQPWVAMWTWHRWYLYQLWHGWPLLDLWWEMTWSALLFAVLYRLTPRIDAWFAGGAVSRGRLVVRTLVSLPLVLGLGINVVGPVLHLPELVVTDLGGPQWPLLVVLVACFGAVFLFSRKRAVGRPPAATLVCGTIYLGCCVAYVTADTAHIGGLTTWTAAMVAATTIVAGVVYRPSLVALPRRWPHLDAPEPGTTPETAAVPDRGPVPSGVLTDR